MYLRHISALRWISIVLLLFNGVPALVGGYILMSDPSGQTMQISLDFLRRSPFSDFLIPGMILLVILGGGSIVAAGSVLAKARWYPVAITAMGCILIIWIVVQILMLRILFFLQFVIGGIGIALLVAGLVQWRRTHQSPVC